MPRLSGRSRRGCFPFLPRCLAAVPRREAPVPDASPGAGSGGAGRHGALAGRVPRVSALVFCASLAAALLGAGGSAEAQEVLVTNYNSASSSAVRLGTASGATDALQLFTTGTNSGGYTLTSITFELVPQASNTAVPTVKLYNVTVAGASVTLGTAVATLTTSATAVLLAAAETYTAPANTTLDTSTTYGIFAEGGGDALFWAISTTGDEDGTPAVGWSIGDNMATRAHDATGVFTVGSDGPGQIQVNGTVKTGTNTPATGAPTITGTPTVGETLTADTTAIVDADGLTNVSYTYQWIRTAAGVETNIASATASTYTLVTDDLGTTIKVKVSFTDDASNAETLTSVATAVVAAAPDTTPPTLTSATVLGSGGAIEFQFSENVQRLSPPRASAFTATADGSAVTTSSPRGIAGVHDVIRITISPAILQGQAVVVTYTDPTASNDRNAIQDTAGNDAATFTTGMNGVPAVTNNSTVNTPATGAPAITGMAQVGQTLTAGTTAIMDANGLTTPGYTYQWIRTAAGVDTNISGATASAYTLVAADQGTTIKVTVSFTDDASNAETLTSAATAAVSANNPPTSSNKNLALNEDTELNFFASDFTFTDADGDSLSSVKILSLPATDKGTLTFSGMALTSGDLPQTVPVAQFNSLKYVPPANENGGEIPFTSFTFRVNDGTDDSAATYTLSLTVYRVNDAATGQPGITGTAQVGQTLAATAGTIADVDGLPDPFLTDTNTSFQWVRVTSGTDADISGARDSTYTLVADDEGKKIKVKVSFMDTEATTNQTEGPLTSAATATVSASTNTAATGAPTITGTAQVGQTLTAVTTAIMDDDGLTTPGYTYQWIRVATDNTETNISTATASTYTLVTEDLGTTIKVKVSFTDDASNAETLTSVATAVVAAAPDTTPPTLTSATVTGGGEHIEFQFSENIPLLNQPPGSAFTVTADGIAVTTPDSPTWAHPSTPDLLRLRVSPVIIFQGQAVVVTYTDPTAGDDANAIQDTAGNDAATFTTGMNGVPAVTNNSIVTNTPATGAPTITGTAQVGQTLTAGTTAIMDANGLTSVSYTYQWIRTATGVDTNISGATASTYTLVAADLGTTIKVRVSFTDDLNNAETLTSAATATVSASTNTPATGAPTITGTAQVGQTLTAATTAIMDADGLTSVSYTYQWIGVATDSTETNIASATASTYTLVTDDLGTTIKVKVSFTDDANNPETLTSAATAVVSAAPNTLPSASDGTVTTNEDTARTFAAADFNFLDTDPGDTLESVEIITLPASGTGTLALSGTPVTAGQEIAEADIGTLTYTPPANANGTGYASFTFKVSDGTAESAADYTMTITVTAVNDAPTVATAIPDQPATAGTAFSYAFPANTFSDADIGDTLTYAATKADGATLPAWLSFAAGTRTFSGTPQAADVGTVAVKVTASDGNGGSVSDTFDITVSAAGDTTPPTLTSATVFEGGVFINLQFSENMLQSNLPSTTTFTVTAAGSAVTVYNVLLAVAPAPLNAFWILVRPTIHQGQVVVVTYTDPTAGNDAYAIQNTAGNDAATFTTGMDGVPAVTNNSITNTLATGAPTITGTAQVGQTLTADTTAIMDADGLTNVSYTYQWIRVATDNTETNIASATASTYTLVAADQGTTIKVTVSFTDDANNPETLTSAATAAVSAAPNTPATGAPTITGTAQVGQTLTAGTTAIMDAEGLTSVSYTYQWIRVATDNTETNISSAAASTYTLVAADQGTTVKVTVSFTDDASNAETLTSAATAAVSAAPNTPATGAPTITGTAQVGQTLTAGTTAIMDADGLTSVSYTYQWIRVDGGTETNISSAAASTYTLVAADQGTTIKVTVSFTDDASNAETLTSAATAAVSAAPNTPATGAPTITGTAQVGQTLTADTTAIVDADGLTNVSYTYQWIRVDGGTETNIASATASTYTLVAADQGTTIKVTVSFTDDLVVAGVVGEAHRHLDRRALVGRHQGVGARRRPGDVRLSVVAVATRIHWYV